MDGTNKQRNALDYEREGAGSVNKSTESMVEDVFSRSAHQMTQQGSVAMPDSVFSVIRSRRVTGGRDTSPLAHAMRIRNERDALKLPGRRAALAAPRDRQARHRERRGAGPPARVHK